MSLINKMLQDLDSRAAEGAGAATVHADVKAVPSGRSFGALRWLGLSLILLLLVVSLWAYWYRQTWLSGAAVPSAPSAGAPANPPFTVGRYPLGKPAGMGADDAATPPPEASPGFALKLATMLQSIPAALLPKPATPKGGLASLASSASSVPVAAGAPISAQPVATAPLTQVRELKDGERRLAAVNSTGPGIVAAGNARVTVETPVVRQAKETSPQQHTESEYRKAITLLQQGRVAEAIAGLEQVLSLDPQHAAARQTQIGLLLEAKRGDEALRSLQDGLALDPRQPALAMLLARLQVDRAELALAIATLQKSLPSARDRADYQAFLAALLQRDQRHKDAARHFAVALGLVPDNGIWWMGLGISLQAENQTGPALDAFSRARAAHNLTPELQAFVSERINQLK